MGGICPVPIACRKNESTTTNTKDTSPPNTDEPTAELAEKKDPRSAKLFYSNRELHRAPYIELLKGLEAANPNFKHIHSITCDPAPEGWSGECGRISAEMLKRHGVDFERAHFYFCGPKDFNGAMQAVLEGAGVAKERIHKEAW